MGKIVYADYNATTPMDSEVKKVFIDALDYYANASSMHEDGRLVAKKIEEARERSRTSGKEFFQKGTDWSKYLEGIPTTIFTGYDSLELENMTLLKDIQTEDGQRVLIFDKTPFYPEM